MATKFDDVKPWPTSPAPAAVGSVSGHNRPPLDVEARAAFDEVLGQRENFRQRIADLIAASDRAVATDATTAGKCGELVKQIRAATKVIDEAHTTTKAPYLAAGREVDTAKNDLVGKLNAAKAKVEAKQTQFLREEDQRRQADARRQQEADDARRREEYEKLLATGLLCQEASPLSGSTYIACGKPAERSIFLVRDDRAYNMCAACAHHNVNSRGGVDLGEASPNNPPVVFEALEPAPIPEPQRDIIRGDFGAAVSGQKVWHSKVEDYEVAFIAAGLAKNEKVREAIDKALANQVRGGVREIEGVRIWSDIKANNR